MTTTTVVSAMTTSQKIASRPTVETNNVMRPPVAKSADGGRVPEYKNLKEMITAAPSGKEVAAPAEPGIVTKFLRRANVFKLFAVLFCRYKLAQRTDRRLRRELGLGADEEGHPRLDSFWEDVHERSAAEMTCAIMSLEGFWVKVGQYLSSRADIMPGPYLRHLSSLQDGMPARPWGDTLRTIEEALSAEQREQLAGVDVAPLSTASLAQVHRATMVDGREVVLKVQHRGVASLMRQDMENFRVLLSVLAYFEPEFDFGAVAAEYSAEVRKELDFRQEAVNMEEVRTLLLAHGVRAIVPRTALATEAVLVMDFCAGFPVRDTAALDRYGVDRDRLLARVCAAWAVQMHVGGAFNADPHMGNVLVSTRDAGADDGDASVPVLLDFGLTKRFDPPMKVAFSRLMHSSYENDVDGLLRSFDEMGLVMNRHDPFEDMAAMRRGFESTVPKSEAKKAKKEKSESNTRRMDALQKDQQEEEGGEKKQKLRNPVEAWPSELVFFGRVTNMLKGMCTHLDVAHPYLETMAAAALQTLRDDVPREEHAATTVHPDAATLSTPLQRRLVAALEQFPAEELGGLQICILHKGRRVADVAAGTLGTANPRPVAPSTLFNVFSVSKGILSIALLRLVQEGRVRLDDPVSRYWPAFGKDDITVRHVLSHQAGLANAIPEDASLDTLLDWAFMKKHMEQALPEHAPGTQTTYHYLTYAWICGGIIEEVTGRPYDQFLEEIFSEADLNLDLFLGGLPEEIDGNRLAVLSVDRKALPKEAPTPVPERNPGADTDVNNSPKKILAKYRGREQLFNPTVFNMRKVRAARLPSANGHVSAASLAAVFDAAIADDGGGRPSLLTADTVDAARRPDGGGAGDDGTGQDALRGDAAVFGLGFSTHEFVLPDGTTARSIGHAGVGGSVVVALPELGLTVAFVTNRLRFGRSDMDIRGALLGAALEEFGLHVPSSL
mmetsp:Transcript_10563/g.21084  ORF Transcript_10563/g.21084 Transcript_10563/m.21084 type:complete len:951 (+) Transcript_10563:196-3048(+)